MSTVDDYYVASTEPQNCTNKMCISDDEYLDEILEYIFPTPVEWIFIILHIFVFVVGLVGNLLVCYAVLRAKHMRNVTNTFIVNLALADFLVILLCQPPSVISDTTETWYLGRVMCKFVTFVQTVSISVSVLTLSAISVERYYAICHPLKFIHTIKRALVVTSLIWAVSILAAVPEIVSMEVSRTLSANITDLLMYCSMSWRPREHLIYLVFQMVCLYFIPILMMTFTYSVIALRLWHTDLPGRDDPGMKMLRNDMASNPETQLLSRRRAAKMLIAMVAIFGFCYLPVYILNLMRNSGLLDKMESKFVPIFALTARWLCYFNSAINPVIYNFMSAKFRKEFRSIFSRCCRPGRRQYVKKSFSTYSYKVPSAFRRTDHFTLSSLSTRQVWSTNNGPRRKSTLTCH